MVTNVIAKESLVMLRSVQMLLATVRNITTYLFIFPGRNMLFCNSRCQGDENAERHCHIKCNLGPWSISKAEWYPMKCLICHRVLRGRGQSE